MKASFVIANYNRKNEVLLTIANTKNLISDNKENFEIIVVDNASSDGSAVAIQSNFPDVILIENQKNVGASGRNLGFEKATGDYIIMLDDDSHIESGLEDALFYMDKNPDVGVLALNVISGPYTSHMWKDGQETVGFIGCGAIIRKETYNKIGGLADWIFLYVEEWEYGLRVIDAGYKVRFFENSRVQHRASMINRTSKRFRINITKNELGIVYKHFSFKRYSYLWRIIGNNLKMIHKVGIKDTWYNVVGMMQFFRSRKKLKYTPVSKEAQLMLVNEYVTLQNSVFGFLFKKKQP